MSNETFKYLEVQLVGAPPQAGASPDGVFLYGTLLYVVENGVPNCMGVANPGMLPWVHNPTQKAQTVSEALQVLKALL